VTGATGFLGGRVARRLVERGYQVRALARKSSSLAALKDLGVEIVYGEIGDKASVVAAVGGVDIVVHAAAAMRGTANDFHVATVEGTRNTLEACRASQVKKLVYISSCNVYEVAGYAEQKILTEEAQLERYPLRRGHYSAAKLQAEALVTNAMNLDPVRKVVLRPGTLYGPGAPIFTKMMGVSFTQRLFLLFGDGETELPLVHVENAVDAILKCITSSAADNQVFNVVDQERISKKTYVERVIKPIYPKAMVIYLPLSLLFAATWLQEWLLGAIGRQPVLSAYRLASSQKRIRYATSKIESALGWRSRITFSQAAAQMVGRHRQTPDAESSMTER